MRRLRSFAVMLALTALGALFIHSVAGPARAQGEGNNDNSRIQQGFAIAPVPLNLTGKNHALVGLGSYLVNGAADCNGCHSAGPPTEFASNGNPYQLPPVFSGTKQVNPNTYLGGGRNFGQFPANGPGLGFAQIISRNLTPDKNGLPEGHTFQDFLTIMRTGQDFDNAHPTCTAGPNGQCVPFPFNGALLQIMPWPNIQNMTDRDLLAIYTYLSAIPCIEGDPGVPPAPGPPQSRCH
jgi:hypothetical protein